MKSDLPEGSYLHAYREAGAHADCYTAVVAGACSLPRYVEAFYTTPLFKMERFILTWAVRKPSSDEDAALLASGAADGFAAWTVERRADDQLLMCDYVKRTRSWFMVAPEPGAGSTRLFFGSAVTAVGKDRAERPTIGLFKAMLWFHYIYSILLLRAACRRLRVR